MKSSTRICIIAQWINALVISLSRFVRFLFCHVNKMKTIPGWGKRRCTENHYSLSNKFSFIAIQARRSNNVKLLRLLPFSVSVSRETNIKKSLHYLSILLQQHSLIHFFSLRKHKRGNSARIRNKNEYHICGSCLT